MLKSRLPEWVMSEMTETLISEQAELFIQERRFHIEIRDAVRRAGGEELPENFQRWALAQSKRFQMAHRRLSARWRRLTGQFRG